MAKVKSESARVDRDSLGECLHTALRKCCDSKPTTILYLVVNLAPGILWGAYLDHVWKEAVSKAKPDEVGEALKAASESFDRVWIELYRSGKLKATDDERRQMNTIQTLMQCAFALMDEGDWNGYASFVFEY